MKMVKFFCVCAAAVGLSAMLCAVEPKDVAGKQIEWCMIGDSITWAGNGDCFRKELLKHIPELAFMGTHTAKFGYSHAGEGGNTTHRVLARLDDPSRVPNSRYYHLLIGVNDSSVTKDMADVEKNAKPIADRILKILDNLTARPGTDKVFWGTILPCAVEGKKTPAVIAKFERRDATASAVNKILRDAVSKYGDKVVIIEYEKPLREIADWQSMIRLHPTPKGYEVIGNIAAPYIKKHAKAANEKLDKFGVEVTNLYLARRKCTSPLVPGWYTVSFDVKSVKGDKINLHLGSRSPSQYKTPLDQKVSVKAKAGERVYVNFFTQYEGYGYNMSPVVVTPTNGEIDNIMVEKTRPSQKPSVYGVGTFVDSTSPVSLGEKMVSAK